MCVYVCMKARPSVGHIRYACLGDFLCVCVCMYMYMYVYIYVYVVVSCVRECT